MDTPSPAPAMPSWWEDPDLAIAVAEVERFADSAGWDRPPMMFALVSTQDLVAAGGLVPGPDDGAFTAIAQEALPVADGDLSAALAGIAWPDEVAGCVLVQEIVVLPPRATADGPLTDEQAAAHPDRTEARLVAGVLRDTPGGACLLRVRPAGPDAGEEPDLLRGGDLAPNLIRVLQQTFS